MRRRSLEQPPQMSDLNIVLLGMTGSGKSASGNTILGGDRKTFKEDFSYESVTKNCQSAQTVVNEQTITVTDTVGVYDTDLKIQDAQTVIEKIFTLHSIDVFLLVIRLGERFTEQNSEVVKWIHENFGEKALKHTIVLFTHGDQLQGPVERYLSESETLRSVVDQCSGRYHVFNNKDEDRSQVTELLEKTGSLRMMNGYRRYTEQDYKETQNKILHKTCAAGAAVGGVGGGAAGAAGGAVAAKAGAVALTVGKAAVIGATGGAALAAAAACVGVYFLARKYVSREKNKTN